MDDDLDYLIEHPDPVPFTDWRKLALHALSDLRALGVPIERIVGMTDTVLDEVEQYERGQTAYS